MIDKDTKETLLKELEAHGFILGACRKVGISRATFYRWTEQDKTFSQRATDALRYGRENMCDAAENSLMGLIKEKNFKAIEYYLRNNSLRYKQMRESKGFFEYKIHSKETTGKNKTIEDLLDTEADEKEKLEPTTPKPSSSESQTQTQK